MDLYDPHRRDGLIAISLKDNDRLISGGACGARGAHGVVRRQGHLWDEGEVRAMGRDTMGVRHERAADRQVLGMEIARPDTDLFVITEKGYGKRIIAEYPESTITRRPGRVHPSTTKPKKGRWPSSRRSSAAGTDEIDHVRRGGVCVQFRWQGVSN